MPTSQHADVQRAEDLARQAEELTQKMKVGGWESIQALALISIARSLSAIAGRAAADEGDALR